LRKALQIFGAPVNYVTAPGWVMGAAWGLYFLLILLFFKEPNRDHVIPDSKHSSRHSSRHGSRHSSKSTNLGTTTDDSAPTMSSPLLYETSLHPLHLEQNKDGDISDDGDDSVVSSEYSDAKAVQNLTELLKELTLPVRVLLTIYFMMKFTSEILISESGILTSFYFNWSTFQVRLLIIQQSLQIQVTKL
jgi:hypothetical protein